MGFCVWLLAPSLLSSFSSVQCKDWTQSSNDCIELSASFIDRESMPLENHLGIMAYNNRTRCFLHKHVHVCILVYISGSNRFIFEDRVCFKIPRGIFVAKLCRIPLSSIHMTSASQSKVVLCFVFVWWWNDLSFK